MRVIADNKQTGKRCIVCGENKSGIEIKHDFIFEILKRIIHGWRILIRQSEKNKRNYTLVVCKPCYSKYYKLRSRYVKREIVFIALGVVFTVMLVVFSHSLLALFYGLALTAFFYLFSQLNYMPALNISKQLSKRLSAAEQKRK